MHNINTENVPDYKMLSDGWFIKEDYFKVGLGIWQLFYKLIKEGL